MKIAYVGDFINHGTSLQTSGTSLVILLSRIENVASVDVYCPEKYKIFEEFKTPENVRINGFYRYDNPISLIKLLGISWKSYDLVIFNILPTGFGKGSISNATALAIPLLLTKLLRINNIKIIYHNSVYTNDIKTLGYNSVYDRIRSYFLGRMEKTMFKSIPTYVLLDLYKARIDKAIGKNMVRVLNARYLEAITTVYMNNLIDRELIETEKSEIPVILLHGFWGPQKNIELALSNLLKLRNNGKKFRLVISGGINTHFPNYEAEFKKLLDLYSNAIDEYLGYVKEKDLMDIFLKTDLLILPYNTPGGHSGVLEQGMFFELLSIAIDFPEYKEQANGSSLVKLTERGNFGEIVMLSLNSNEKKKIVLIKSKVILIQNNIKLILNSGERGDD